MALSTPDVSIRPVSTVRVPPTSPSKRRQATSHYNDLESSPSKKRAPTMRTVVLEDNERRLLFTETTNNRPGVVVDEVFDLSMQDVEIIKPKTRATAPKPTQEKTKAVTSRSRSAKTEVTKAKPASRLPVGKEKSGGRPIRVR
jgi:NAD-dependent histone deacetylase SIR2